MTTTPVPQPITQYRFACNRNGEAEANQDEALGNLYPLSLYSPAICQFYSNGATFGDSPLQSQRKMANLLQSYATATSMALELWITPPSPSVQDYRHAPAHPILSVEGAPSSEPSLLDDPDCGTFDFYVGLRALVLEIRYKDANGSCKILYVKQQALQALQRNHVVFEWKEGGTWIHLDGVAVISQARNSFDPTLSQWNPFHHLRLFASDFYANQHYNGALHQVSFYAQAIDDIPSLYQQGQQDLDDRDALQEPLRLVARSDDDDDALVATQGDVSSLWLRAFNASTSDWEIQVELVDLPRHGRILDEEGKVYSAGARIPLGNSNNEAQVVYESLSSEYFSVPSHSVDGTDLLRDPEVFSFRLVAVGHYGDLVGWSETVQQEIWVVHVNHPPSLLVPNQIDLYLPQDQVSNVAARPIALLGSNVALRDVDWDIDRVRVDLWAHNGSLVFSEELMDLVDFDDDCTSSTSWRCRVMPRGMANRNMTFVAVPSLVTRVLSELEYQAYYWDQDDQVRIRIFDGVGGPCLTQEDHHVGRIDPTGTIHRDCFAIDTSIKIPGVSREVLVAAQSIGGIRGYMRELFDIGEFGLPDVIFWVFVLLVLVFCCTCIRTCRRLVARGTRVKPFKLSQG